MPCLDAVRRYDTGRHGVPGWSGPRVHGDRSRGNRSNRKGGGRSRRAPLHHVVARHGGGAFRMAVTSGDPGRRASALVRAGRPAARAGVHRHRQPRQRHDQDVRRDGPGERRRVLRRRSRRRRTRPSRASCSRTCRASATSARCSTSWARRSTRSSSPRRTTRTSRWRCTRWRTGKHVYVEKPLAHTFREVDLLMAMAAKTGVVTQMGNQGHSGNNYFQFKAWTEAGIIKDVTKIVAFMNSRAPLARLEGGRASRPASRCRRAWTGTPGTRARPVAPVQRAAASADLARLVRLRQRRASATGARTSSTPRTGSCELGLPHTIEAVRREGASQFIFPQASTIRFDFAARGEHAAGRGVLVRRRRRTGRRCRPNSGQARR